MDRLVDFSSGDIVKVHSDRLDEFKRYVHDNQIKKRYRYCMQESPDAVLQDMFICRTKGDYIRPDKHYGIPESHTIIEGREAILLFSDDGIIIDSFILDRIGGFLSYRINSDIFHMTIPITEYAIDYEVKLGPFSNNSNTYPDWAPDGSSIKDVQNFLRRIEQELKHNGIIIE